MLTNSHNILSCQQRYIFDHDHCAVADQEVWREACISLYPSIKEAVLGIDLMVQHTSIPNSLSNLAHQVVGCRGHTNQIPNSGPADI